MPSRISSFFNIFRRQPKAPRLVINPNVARLTFKRTVEKESPAKLPLALESAPLPKKSKPKHVSWGDHVPPPPPPPLPEDDDSIPPPPPLPIIEYTKVSYKKLGVKPGQDPVNDFRRASK